MITAPIISARLCDGISVDIPTAIPELPLINILGTLEGRVLGSSRVPSKLGAHLTVPMFISSKNKSENFVSLDSVYLMAANDFGSS